MLIHSIERLWLEAERLSRPVVRFRAPGVGADEVRAAFRGAVPDDVVTWFGWSNGVAYGPGQTQDDAALVPGYEPLSLSEASSVRYTYGINDPVLGDYWVPLLATGGGDFYSAVYDSSLGAPKVAHLMVGDEAQIVYQSVEEMVEAFCDFYRTGVFFVSDEGILEADDTRWVESESGS